MATMGTILRGRDHRGFTLIELLVVVAILSLLLSILLPSLQKAKQQAYALQCMANLRAGDLAVLQYANEYQVFPLGDYTWISALSNAKVIEGPKALSYTPIHNPAARLFCPNYVRKEYWAGHTAEHILTYGLPAYSSNTSSETANFPIGGRHFNGSVTKPFTHRSLYDVNHPADTISILEIKSSQQTWVYANDKSWVARYWAVADTHLGSANFAWGDGHVSRHPSAFGADTRAIDKMCQSRK